MSIKKDIWFIILFSLFSMDIFSQSKEYQSLKINDAAPIFVLRNLQGENIFLRDFCGSLRQPWKNKIKHFVILSFFTSYCQPCLKEIPELEQLFANYKNNHIKIFLINLKEEKELVQKFVNEKKIKLPVLLDKYGVVAKKYGVTSIPRIFVITPEGNLIWMTKGFIENLNEKLLETLQTQFEIK